MDIAEALQITIELARQNIADQLDHPDHHKTQTEAVDMVEDLAVNEYGDDDLVEPTEDERIDWIYAVGNGDTKRGLIEWVQARREDAQVEP